MDLAKTEPHQYTVSKEAQPTMLAAGDYSRRPGCTHTHLEEAPTLLLHTTLP
jgi:hypothetical protein